MELRKGYKHSILGPIPVDWIEGTFEDFMTGFSSGQTPYRAIAEYYKGDIPWITSGELNYNNVTNTIEKISKEGAKAANLKMIPKGTFLFAITGLEAAGTRGSCAITGIEATTNQSCMALYPKSNVAITPYIFQFYVKYGNWLAFNYCQGTKQQSYTGGIAKKLPFVAPSTIKEQTAIATALSDADAYISALEKLIEKKRNIKQGAMQQLLKPKKGWVVKKLGEIGKCYRGVSYNPERDLHPHDKNNTVRLLRSNNIQNQIIDLDGLQFVDQEKVKLNQILQEKDTVICMANGSKQLVGKSAIYKVTDNLRYTFGAFMGCYRTNESITSSIYVALNFQSFQYRNYINVLLSGSSINNLNPGNIESIEIPFPPIEEQTRIASIVLDMDNEISSLEKKLSKSKMLKQGMMQELLTGKIRLI